MSTTEPIASAGPTVASEQSVHRRLRRVKCQSEPLPTGAIRKPGYMEMDLVADCGQLLAGSFVHILTLTDVASGWTECAPLLVREAALVCQSLQALRLQLAFDLRGLDVDNGSEFINDDALGLLPGACH